MEIARREEVLNSPDPLHMVAIDEFEAHFDVVDDVDDDVVDFALMTSTFRCLIGFYDDEKSHQPLVHVQPYCTMVELRVVEDARKMTSRDDDVTTSIQLTRVILPIGVCCNAK